jgi:hypothetical protein
MPEIEKFQGFFSYAHLDAQNDSKLVEALTTELERRVSAKLTNAEFSIWRDTAGLRTGEKWNDKIVHTIQNSQIFIVLLTPKWIQSEYCRKEYECFLAVEESIGVGHYVAPLLIRSVESQVPRFNPDQKATYDSLTERQYKKILATDFLRQSEDQRTLWIESVADDIDAMIERLRTVEPPSGVAKISTKAPDRKKREFDARAHNFREVDFLSSAEVLIDPPDGTERRSVYAYLEFLPRMYVQASSARIEFGIRRATLSLHDEGDNSIARNEEWVGSASSRNAYYITPRDAPNSLAVCVDPTTGQSTLRELPLPPSPGENRLSKIATTGPDANLSELRAELSVNLSQEGLYIFSGDDDRPTPTLLRKIEAIMKIAAEKEASKSETRLVREIPVRERRK